MKNLMKNLSAMWGVLLVLGVMALAAACSTTPSGQQQENDAQRGIQQGLLQAQPLPGIRYSQMRQNLIELEQAEAKGVQTTSFIFGNFSPDPVQICPSIGVPIPNTASLSNPEQLAYTQGGGGITTIPQMDPNGVYTPTTSQGTFVQCVGPDGKVLPVYAEGIVNAVFGPATWDYGKHAVVLTGPASYGFTSGGS